MKKKFTKTIALFLCLVMAAGCNTSSKPEQTTSKESGSKGNSITLLSDIKAKYANEENVEYTEPMYNLEKDAVFTFDNLPEAYFENEDKDCFAVYYDSEMTEPVDIHIERDYDNNSVTVSPSMTFYYNNPSEGCFINDNWGSYSKFWLVRNVDLKTGKMLDKPQVTVFTTKEELNAPTLEQSVSNTGLYTLSWSEVEGADYYEVYNYVDVYDYCRIEVTTESTSCTHNDFKSEIDYVRDFKDTYRGTEIDVDDPTIYFINRHIEEDGHYFVVARTNDGKTSGMSNVGEVSKIANQIPVTLSRNFPREYNGTTATVLPAYAKVEMVDGSDCDFLIQYHGATLNLLNDGRIFVTCKFKNLPIHLPILSFTGMDYDTFKEETELLTKREDELTTKSVTGNKNITIPYLPTQDVTIPSTKETSDPNTVTETPSIDEPEPDAPTSSPDDGSTKETPSAKTASINLDEELQNSVYANSAMTEWIALNMLSHQEEIYLGDFPENADSEKITSSLLEAYNQNPLIGIMDNADYNYNTKTLKITYVMSKEDTEKMQKESLSKAKEIVSSIIKDGMSDYEKEDAINDYLCKNASYNEKILEYINDDGTISDSATEEFANSFTPFGVLVENLGVCESYAESFLLLAKEAGLEAIIVTGTLDGVNHEWNRVKLEDSWYTLDVTNNDSETVPNGYFNLSDELAATVLKENNTYLANTSPDWLHAGDNNYEYYTKNQWIANEEDSAVNILSELLKDQNQAAIRLDGELNNTQAEQIAQSTCNKGKIASAKYYYRAGVLSIVKE